MFSFKTVTPNEVTNDIDPNTVFTYMQGLLPNQVAWSIIYRADDKYSGQEVEPKSKPNETLFEDC